MAMRIIARKVLVDFYTTNPNSKAALERWYSLTKAATWNTMDDVRQTFGGAVPLNSERIRFEIAGGNYRLIASVDLSPKRQFLYIKFIGTHAEYDKVDALTVSQF